MAVVRVREDLFPEIEKIELSGRQARLKKRYLDDPAQVSGDRAKLAMESWKATEGEPLIRRLALKLKKILEEVPIAIHDDELLVGSNTKYFHGADPHLEYDCEQTAKTMEEEGRITLGGEKIVGAVSEEDWQKVKEVALYFAHQKSVAERAREARRALVGEWAEELIEAGGTQRYEHLPLPPSNLDFEKVITKGLRSIIEEAKEKICHLEENRDDELEKLYFWQSSLIVCEAVITFAHRYAKLTSELAAQEKNRQRKEELKEMARVCEQVPEKPARTFQEALQVVMLIAAAEHYECPLVPPTGYGHLDKYLYPYFMNDLEEGRLTLEKAADLLGCFFTYINKVEWVLSLEWRDYEQKGVLQSITVSGPNRDGEDTSNELTYLLLHVAGLLRYPEPHLAFRWHKGTPRWLMRKAIETNARVGGGVPQFQNSEHVVRYLTGRGIPLESARLWMGHGCSQTQPPEQPSTMFPQYLNTILPLDWVLHRGVCSGTGKKLGLDTGDPSNFKTYEEFYEAYQKQCEFMFKRVLWLDNVVDRTRMTYWAYPLASTLYQSCLDNGKDFSAGGFGSYPLWLKKDRGLVSAADSLMAVKRLVYDEKKVTMSELIEALNHNFEGERGEEIRQMCLAAPKFGNDIDEVDYLLRDLAKFTARLITSSKNIFGQPFAINRNGQAWHSYAGKRMGASPNGRKARQPLADGSISPAQGMDTKGPTAVLNSVIKADFKETEQAILNQRFPAQLFRSPETRDKIISLTETFFNRGGSYIQYNILDAQTLREAKKHPEQYKDLVVRVGGYSAFFVNLTDDVQDEIIARSEQVI